MIVVTVIALLLPVGKGSHSFKAVPNQTNTVTMEKDSTKNHIMVDDSSVGKEKNE